MQNPLVTVGIPTYGRPEGLLRTLGCISTQVYSNLEIIISVNPTTNEDTNQEIMQIISKYMERDRRIKVVYQIENVGLASNWRYVLYNAHGEYFMYAPNDDFWSLWHIDDLVQALKAHPGAEVAVANSCYEDEDGIAVSKFDFTKKGTLGIICSEYAPFVLMGLFKTSTMREFDCNIHDHHGKDVAIVAEILLSRGYAISSHFTYRKAMHHGKTKEYFRENPLCLLDMYWNTIKGIVLSRHMPLQEKSIVVIVAPWMGLYVARAYLAQILFLLPYDHPVRKFVRGVVSSR